MIEKLGIKIGQTVTKSIIDKAASGGLPDAVMSELWLRRTLNRRAMQAIEAALASEPQTVTKKAKTKSEESE